MGCDILARSDDTYRLCREAMRAKLLEGLTPEELRSFHGALAHALMQARPELFNAIATLTTQDLGLLLQAAAHIERAGNEARGRALSRKVAIELTMRGDGLSEAVPAAVLTE